MIVRSKYGDAASMTLFDATVGPYQVTFVNPDTWTAIVSGSSGLQNSSMYSSANLSWGGSVLTLVQKLLAAAAAKTNQSGPLATAAAQTKKLLQSDVNAIDGVIGTARTAPIIGGAAFLAPVMAAVTALQSDISNAGTTLMAASAQDTGPSTSATTATIPVSQAAAIAGNAVAPIAPTQFGMPLPTPPANNTPYYIGGAVVFLLGILLLTGGQHDAQHAS